MSTEGYGLELNILIIGVGGQGTLLSSRFLGDVALRLGRDVKVSEVHGMSQRGGSVETCVRIGENIASPIIDRGMADVVLSFESVEALRALDYLKPGGTVIMNTQEILPMPVISGTAVYPENVPERLKGGNYNVISLDALGIAESCGSPKCVNVVLLGVLSGTIPGIPEEVWLESLKNVVPAKLLDVNLRAFEAGRKQGGNETKV
ncbi:MAG: indolepyruvate oxidoreductase subunit beta [Clostridia bacterium]|nr:indolepyruvate oxidoreductase subunit beta [Clostridia bacterium]